MADTQHDVELSSTHPSTNGIPPAPSTNVEIEHPQLPLPDTSRSAYLVLAGCTLIQAPVWGYSLAFGIFQEYYLSHPELFKDGAKNVAVIGTTINGVVYLTSPFTFALLARWPHLRPYFGPIGLFLAVVGTLASSFATTVTQLIITQGVISALGCGLLFTPITFYLDEWFVQRKGLAMGIMWAGKSITGVAIPFIMEASLQRFGPARTLQAWSVISVLLAAPLLPTLRPRVPLPQTHTPRPISLSFLYHPTFYLHTTSTILQSAGYFLPYAYISTYAVSACHLSPTAGSLILALINTSSVPGGIVLGGLSDKHLTVSTTILISTLGSAVAVFALWGTSTGLPLLCIFSLVYGFFGGGFSSTWSGILADIKRECEDVETGFLFGLLAGGRGVGSVISGPLSVAVGKGMGSVGRGKGAGYGGEFGGIILFTGITAVMGGWGAMGRLWL